MQKKKKARKELKGIKYISNVQIKIFRVIGSYAFQMMH